MGEGLFKAGTTHKDGIFQCPSDVSFDIKEGEGHTQSSTLDKVAEVLRKLKQMQNALVGESKADAAWVPVEAANSANTATPASPANTSAPLAAVRQTATEGANTAPPPDPLDSGRVKRQAIEVAGANGPQIQPAQSKS